MEKKKFEFSDDEEETRRREEEEDALPPIPQWQEFNEQEAKQKIIERYKKTKRRPGQPIYVPSLLHVPEDVTPFDGFLLLVLTHE